MKRGFTLIELLAVIVILAIIALIATPIVLNIINETKDNASLRSAEFYLDAAEQSILLATLNNRRITDGKYNVIDGDICLNNDCTDKLIVEIKGEKPSSGTISIKDGKIEDISLNLNNKVIVKDENEKLEIKKPEQETPDIEDEIPTPKSFAEDSWETIAQNVKIGNISAYKVGDTKEIALAGFTNEEKDENGNNTVTYTIRIANTSTPEECNTEGFSQTACGFVVEFQDIITTHVMNPSIDTGEGWTTSTNKGGYPASSMYTYVNETIYNALPEEIKEYIIDTYVVSGHGSEDTSNITSTDKLYLLSTGEIWEQGTSNQITCDTARDVTRQLDYYKNLGATTNNYSGAIKELNGSAHSWWLRSAGSDATYSFYGVHYSGDWSRDDAYYTNGAAVAFRI